MEWKNKKVIITGAAGVIGKELVEKLVEARAYVRCFDIAPKPSWFPKDAEYSRYDLVGLNPIAFTSFNPDIIFHLAATFERTIEDTNFWEFNFENNIFLSHKVLHAAKQCKNLKKFVFASSYLIYDAQQYLFKASQKKAILLSENMSIDTRNLCGAAKYYTEKELEYLAQFHEFTQVSARIFRVYGKNSRDVLSRWVRAGIYNESINVFLKENLFDYIFAGDVAEGLLKLAESDSAQGPVNLGTGSARNTEEALSIIERYIPGMHIEETDEAGLFEASGADMSAFKQLCGWLPSVTLEQGIKTLIDYEKAQQSKDSQ